jgi:hypothetical protein
MARGTLSAHEIGQNTISPEAAGFYSTAYACTAEWLIEGKSPSGLPAVAEANLEELLELHAHAESVAREAIFSLRGRPAGIRQATEKASYSRTRQPRPAAGPNFVPEVTGIELYRARRLLKPPRPTKNRFGMPPGYLSDDIGCGPNAVVVAGCPDDLGKMANLVIDLDFRPVEKAETYAVVDMDGIVDAVAGAEALSDERSGTRYIVGKVYLVMRRHVPDSPVHKPKM